MSGTRVRVALAALGVVASLTLAGMWHAFGRPSDAAPGFATVRGAWRPSDVRLLDRHGDVLQERRIDPVLRRLAWTPLEQVSPALVQAVLLSEDRRFREHHGVDLRALAAGARDAILYGRRRGARRNCSACLYIEECLEFSISSSSFT